MMVSHEIRYPLDHLRLKTKKLHHLLCLSRTLLLLKRSVVPAILLHRRTDSDIMNIGRSLQNVQGPLVQMLLLANQLRKAVHLRKMLDLLWIPSVIFDHFFVKIIQSAHNIASRIVLRFPHVFYYSRFL